MQIYHEHVQYSTVQYRSNCVYGQGLSELILIKFILHSSQSIHVDTKSSSKIQGNSDIILNWYPNNANLPKTQLALPIRDNNICCH